MEDNNSPMIIADAKSILKLRIAIDLATIKPTQLSEAIDIFNRLKDFTKSDLMILVDYFNVKDFEA